MTALAAVTVAAAGLFVALYASLYRDERRQQRRDQRARWHVKPPS